MILPAWFLDAKYVWVTDSAKSRAIATGISAYYNYSDNDYEFTTPYMDTVVTRDHDRYYSYNVLPFVSFEKYFFDKATLGVIYSAMDKEIQSNSHRIEEALLHIQKSLLKYIWNVTCVVL